MSSVVNLSIVKKYIPPALIISVFIYVIVRASLIDITHDEAYSFYNMKKFWYAEALCTGNTHWLNSAAIKAAIFLNCENLLCIRWLSVFSALIICIMIWRWVKVTKNPAGQFLIIAVALCNPYMLDYLSIARGYAPGMMLEFLALFYIVRAEEDKNKNTRFLSLVFAGFSALANFSYIYFFFCFCLLYFFRFYFSRKKFLTDKNFYRDLIFSIGIAAIVARAFLFITRCSNDVVGAGTDNLKEFFHVFTDGLIYLKWTPDFNTLTFLGAGIFFFVLISAINGLFKKDTNSLYYVSSLIFVFIVILLAINHFVFRLVYPYYRSAVFLFPVSAVSVICFLMDINKKVRGTSLFISALLIINFLLSANVKWVLDFKIQCELKESLDYTESAGAKHVGISPELYGGYRNYHQMTWKYYYDFFGEPINTNLPRGISKDEHFLQKFDHLILFPPYDLTFYRNNKVKLKGLKMLPETGTIIVSVEK